MFIWPMPLANWKASLNKRLNAYGSSTNTRHSVAKFTSTPTHTHTHTQNDCSLFTFYTIQGNIKRVISPITNLFLPSHKYSLYRYIKRHTHLYSHKRLIHSPFQVIYALPPPSAFSYYLSHLIVMFFSKRI